MWVIVYAKQLLACTPRLGPNNWNELFGRTQSIWRNFYVYTKFNDIPVLSWNWISSWVYEPAKQYIKQIRANHCDQLVRL